MKYQKITTSAALINFASAFSMKSYDIKSSFKNDRRKLYSDYVNISKDLSVGISKINKKWETKLELLD